VKPCAIVRAGNPRRFRNVAIVWLITSMIPAMLAHRVDELLQSTLLSVAPDTVTMEITITPGIEVIDSILALIDQDHDGKISETEAVVYAKRVLKSVELTLDRRTLELKLVGQEVASLADARSGLGLIRIKADAALGKVANGRHAITFRCRHPNPAAAFLANALVPESSAIRILRQRRDESQSELTVDYRLQQPSAPLSARGRDSTLRPAQD